MSLEGQKWKITFQNTLYDQFTIDFNETTSIPLFGEHYIYGTMYYDAVNNRERVDRHNGRYDRYCGNNGFYNLFDTSCSHIIVDGDRYMYYPEKNDCCFCCDASSGCGIVKNDWLTGAQYKGITQHKGFDVYWWDQPGLQSNYYFETISDNPEDRVMVGLYQLPNDN